MLIFVWAAHRPLNLQINFHRFLAKHSLGVTILLALNMFWWFLDANTFLITDLNDVWMNKALGLPDKAPKLVETGLVWADKAIIIFLDKGFGWGDKV